MSNKGERRKTMLSKSIQPPGAAETAPAVPAIDARQSAAIFDVDSLLQRLMGDRELAGDVLTGFLEDGPAQLRQLRARLDEEDARGVRLQAHTLKGAAATVGAEALREIAMAMETGAEAGLLDDCRGLLPHAHKEFERFKTAVKLGGWLSHAKAKSEIENLT